ncbi:MAG: hypothetical protein H2057_04775 [Alphaproteobacteria bacterium]|nr:hypothetical protein [Alphaproteobacteria bacterium]
MTVLFRLFVMMSFCTGTLMASLDATPEQERAVLGKLFDLPKERAAQKADSKRDIAAFLVAKIKEDIKMTPKLGDELFMEEEMIPDEERLQVIHFDDETRLVVLSLARHAYQESGCLFLIKRDEVDWTPLSFDSVREEGRRQNFSVITSFVEWHAPILTLWGRSTGWNPSLGVKESYLYEKGRFELLSSYEVKADMPSAEEPKNVRYTDQIYYLDPRLVKLLGHPLEDVSLETLRNVFIPKEAQIQLYPENAAPYKVDFFAVLFEKPKGKKSKLQGIDINGNKVVGTVFTKSFAPLLLGN